LNAESFVRLGKSRMAVLRVDPGRFRFMVLAASPGQEGHSAMAWRKTTGALAVVNAGQHAADGSYLGLLVQDGRRQGRLAGNLEALFVAEPNYASLPKARVIDLRYTAFDPLASPYRQAAQSLMLLDRFGHIRVRRSPRVAHRTAVAEDNQGRIIVIITEGGYTLWEFADFLSQVELGLREVMCMDGGPEAQFDLSVDGFDYEQHGGPTDTPDLPLPWPVPPLPAALGIYPR